MIKNNKKSLLMLFLASLAGGLSAQTNGSNSPYSRYGFGLLADPAQGFNKGMGGLSLGMRDGAMLNNQNPASYSAINPLTFLFDIGVSLQNMNLNYNGQKINAKNTSLDYINMGFRAGKNVGISLGFMPFSTIGYSISNSETMDDNDGFGEKTTTTTYNGNGGLRRIYAGIGWSPINRFSIGANLSYLWGDYTHRTSASFSETTIQSLSRTYTASINTYKVDFGIQYEQPINEKNRLIFGATYGLGHNINSDAELYNQKLNNGSVIGADTIKTPNAFALPHSFGAGVVWEHNRKIRVGIDYTNEMWSKTKFPQLTEFNGKTYYSSTTGAFTDRYRIITGVEYIPNIDGIRYANHIRYHAGFSFSSPYTKVNGIDGANSYILSVGVGLPIMNLYSNRSVINVSAQWEHVSPKSGNLMKEDYLRLCVGITFNEAWFKKWKVE